MPEGGVVIGGWQFIVPAYLITAAVLAAYVWSIFARGRRFDRNEDKDE